jgi:hypothetical protein
LVSRVASETEARIDDSALYGVLGDEYRINETILGSVAALAKKWSDGQ